MNGKIYMLMHEEDLIQFHNSWGMGGHTERVQPLAR